MTRIRIVGLYIYILLAVVMMVSGERVESGWRVRGEWVEWVNSEWRVVGQWW